MKIRVERDVLAEAVAWAARSLPARPPAPVLAGLLLKAEDGQLSLSSFDYEVSARVHVEAEVEEEGTVLVSGRLLADISRALPNRPVEISTDGVRATVVCGSSRFTLHTLPVEEYPALPQMPNATGTVPGEVFAAAVSQVAIAAGRDDTLPVLTGVRIEIEGDTVTLASPTATASRSASSCGSRRTRTPPPSPWSPPRRCWTPRRRWAPGTASRWRCRAPVPVRA